MSRMLGWHEFTVFMFPIGFSVNTMLMPLLWLFALKNFKVGFRFRYIQLLHFFFPARSCSTSLIFYTKYSITIDGKNLHNLVA